MSVTDIIGVTEMHLDKSVSDNDIRIDGMKTFRQDQKKCKAGGCLIYCRNNLQVILRKDLSACELETVWVQPTSCRFFVIYRLSECLWKRLCNTW